MSTHFLTVATGLALDTIDLRIEPGQLVGVVGPVGSSKSSLLLALLREMAPESSFAGGGSAPSFNVGGSAAHVCTAQYESGEG